MKRILFVCHGNICRSPMAEFVMKKLVRNEGKVDDYEIASAATSPEEVGNPVYPMARQELAKHGIGCPGKTARQVVADDYVRYDIIVGMDEANIKYLKMKFGGDKAKKVSLLLDYTGESRDVADPWYTRDFGAAWNDIWNGCSALLRKLEADG